MVPLKAVVDTALVFIVLFLIASIHSYMIIYRFKLIELFKAESQGERELKPSVLRSILSILLIAGGYLLYIKTSVVYIVLTIPVTLLLTVLGTFMVFSSLILLIIKLSKKNERKYFRGTNMIGISQLLFRIKGSARTLATIAVLSATTLTAMEISASFYYSLEVDLQKNFGFTYSYASNDKSLDKEVEAIIEKYPDNKILNSVDMNFALVKGLWPDLYNESSNNKATEADFYIISESDYKKIAEARNLNDKINLENENEAVVFNQIINFTSEHDYSDKTITINEGNEETKLKIVDIKDYSLTNSGMMRNAVVVSDEVYNKYKTNNNSHRIKGYVTDNKKDSEIFTNELTNLLLEKLPSNEGEAPEFSAYYTNYRAAIAFSGLIIFLGAFMGLLFLMATGSIIFFKQLSEANEDKDRYSILRKIGVTNKEIKTSISKQILIVFALPLVIGMTHSLVASKLLTIILRVNLTLPIILTCLAYTVIYMIYYFLTVNSYYNIVSSEKIS